MTKLFGISSRGKFLVKSPRRGPSFAWYSNPSGNIASGSYEQMSKKLTRMRSSHGLEDDVKAARVVEIPDAWQALIEKARNHERLWSDYKSGTGTLRISSATSTGGIFVRAANKNPSPVTLKALESLVKAGGTWHKSSAGYLGVLIK